MVPAFILQGPTPDSCGLVGKLVGKDLLEKVTSEMKPQGRTGISKWLDK